MLFPHLSANNALIDTVNIFDSSIITHHNIGKSKEKSFSPAYIFNGIDSYIELVDTFNNTFSFCGWIKPEHLLNKNMAIVGIPDVFWFRTTNTRELQFTRPGVIDINTKGLLLSNHSWVFVSFIIDYPMVKVYVNAKLVGQYSWVGNAFRSTSKVFIGRDNWQDFFYGAMHQVSIYKHAINERQIIELYQHTASEEHLSSGIVLYHPLNNRTTFFSAAAETEYAHVHFVNDSVRGKVAQFGGGDSYIDFGTLPIDNAVSISVWLKPDVFDRDFGAIASLGHAYAFRLLSGGLLLFTIPQLADISDADARLTGHRWQHVVFTFKEGVGVTFYINGQKRKFTAISEFKNADKKLKVGTNLWNDFFKGRMDELIIWNRVLKSEEIKAVYEKRADYRKLIPEKGRFLSVGMPVGFVIFLITGGVILFLFVKKRYSAAPA